jgi:hypothetical protein
MLDELDAGGAHVVAANSCQSERSTARRELARDTGGVRVAGHFSGDKENVTHD